MFLNVARNRGLAKALTQIFFVICKNNNARCDLDFLSPNIQCYSDRNLGCAWFVGWDRVRKLGLGGSHITYIVNRLYVRTSVKQRATNVDLAILGSLVQRSLLVLQKKDYLSLHPKSLSMSRFRNEGKTFVPEHNIEKDARAESRTNRKALPLNMICESGKNNYD